MKLKTLFALLLLTACEDENGIKTGNRNDGASDNRQDAAHVLDSANEAGKDVFSPPDVSQAGIVRMDAIGKANDANPSPTPLQDARPSGKDSGSPEKNPLCGNSAAASPEDYIACCPPGRDCAFLMRPTCDCASARGWEGQGHCNLKAGARPELVFPSFCEETKP